MKVDYPFYSIEITGRHSSFSIAPRDVSAVYSHCHAFGTTSVYSKNQKTKLYHQFDEDLYKDLKDVEEHYPQDTWLSITFYGKALNERETYEASCENGYYCPALSMSIIRYVLDFVKDNLVENFVAKNYM